jgi:hypothetical protein
MNKHIIIMVLALAWLKSSAQRAFFVCRKDYYKFPFTTQNVNRS